MAEATPINRMPSQKQLGPPESASHALHPERQIDSFQFSRLLSQIANVRGWLFSNLTWRLGKILFFKIKIAQSNMGITAFMIP